MDSQESFYDVESARRYFNRWGWLMRITNTLDAPIYRTLLRSGQFESARKVLEIGAGRGPFARQLLSSPDYAAAELVCTEISDTLRKGLQLRLKTYADRVTILADAGPGLPFADQRFDRFVACFVLDMMDESQQCEFISEAYRLLDDQGLVCLMTVCDGTDWYSRRLMRFGKWLSRRSPWLALGARYRDLSYLFRAPHWQILECRTWVRFGCATKILIARKCSPTIEPSLNSSN